MDIEEVGPDPEDSRVKIDPGVGLTSEQAAEVSRKIGIPEAPPSHRFANYIVHSMKRRHWSKSTRLS
jgi:succinyl-CoA synthetase beta subunit